MAATSYLPGYLDNPDQVPIEDIPQTLDATENAIHALRLALQRRLDPVNGSRALQHMERVHSDIKQRLLNYVQQVKNLPSMDIVLYEEQNGPIDHHVLYASVNHLADEEEKAAFSVSGALSHAGKYVNILREVYLLVLKLIAVVSPVTGVKPIAAQSNAAFERDLPISEKAVYKPDALYMSLFTAPALTLIQQEERAVEQQDEEGIKALRDISLIHFFSKKEDEQFELRAASKSGYIDCRTQQQEGISALVLGGRINPNEIVLWNDNTVLSWRLIDETFETQEQFTFAETGMQASTAAWNKVKPGGVTFIRSDKAEDATFKVKYVKQKKGRSGATGFFPAQYVNGSSTLKIYSTAFQQKYISLLSRMLCHELGHILGFRHEFALEKERNTQAGRFGERDSNSIMSYSSPPVITLLDVTTSRSAYEHFRGDGEFSLDDGRGNMIRFTVTRIDP